MNKLYNSGIQGYTLKGNIGESGSPSYNMYYSVYDCSTDSSIVSALINDNKTLSKNPNTIEGGYKTHDVIIDCNAHMYELNRDSSNNINITYIGNIINQTSSDDITVDMSNRDCSINLSSTEIEIESNYSPYLHHKETNYGTKINVYNNAPEETHKKLVVVHRCGLTQEFDIDETTEIKISDKYAYLVADETGKKYNTTDKLPISHINHTDYFIKDCSVYLDVYNKNSMYRFDVSIN